MGRYRPPSPSSSPYITADGHRALRDELKQLWRVERPEVTRALAAAAAEGDRSENAEYTYRKKQLGGIDRRIRYLSKRLDVLQIVDRRPKDQSRAFFGCYVKIQTGTEAVRWLRLVGADEADPGTGRISVDSPLAQALLGKGAGSEVDIELPEGASRVVLHRVQYEPPSD